MKQPDILDREVVALAELAIARYGERAPTYAVLQALKARYQRKAKETAAWQRIADSANAILRAEPSWNERITQPHAATGGEHLVTRARPTIERIALRLAPTRDLPELNRAR